MEKFEIGDKVKLVRLDVKDRLYVKMMNEFLGKKMTVRKCTMYNDFLDVGVKENNLWFNADWLELVEKKKNGWTGQVVCVAITCHCGEYFTPGKVYNVKDGYLIDKTGAPYTPTLFNSVNSLIAYFETPPRPYRFIEFKGFNENKEETK